MSGHPSPEELFACASQSAADGDPAVRAHVRECEACTRQFARLSAGARMLADARGAAPPQVVWSGIDAAVMAAAEATARDIRRGALRAPRRIAGPAFVGVALAAAAAGVLAFRAGVFTRPAPGPTAAAGHTGASGGAREPASPEATVLEGSVLLVAAPVSHAAAGGTAAPLGATTVLREGARLAVGEQRGRAVLALRRGYRVDLRAAAEVTLVRLREDRTDVELTKGEVRVDAPARDEARLALDAAGWTLVSKGGAFTASIEADVVRVRVLSGKIGVRRGDGSERDILATSEIELAKDGPDLRVVSHDASDPRELDVGFLSPDGAVVALPELPVGATILRVGAGPLPDGLLAMRTGMAMTLEARRGAETWSLQIAPNAPSPSWVPSAPAPVTPAVVPTSGGAPTPSRQLASRTLGPTPGPRRAPGSASATVGPGSQAAAPQPAEALSPQARAGLRAVVRMLGARTQSCFEVCDRAGNCGASALGEIRFHLDDSGHVTSASTNGFTPGLNACVEREARSVPFPAELGGATVPLQIRNPYARGQ